MKTFLVSIFTFLHQLFSPSPTPELTSIPESIYDFKFEALDGSSIDMANYKGKKILIVNTASKCGYTKQYEKLQALHDKYQDKLIVIGFPANNFMRQEPGTNDQIEEFCRKNYGVSFPMAAKISVKGKDMAPIYQWLTQKKYNQLEDAAIKWNFQKFLIDENGRLMNIFSPGTEPDAKEVIEAIES